MRRGLSRRGRFDCGGGSNSSGSRRRAKNALLEHLLSVLQRLHSGRVRRSAHVPMSKPAFPLWFRARRSGLGRPYCTDCSASDDYGERASRNGVARLSIRACRILESEERSDGNHRRAPWRSGPFDIVYSRLARHNPFRGTPMPNKRRQNELSRDEEAFLITGCATEANFRDGPGPARQKSYNSSTMPCGPSSRLDRAAIPDPDTNKPPSSQSDAAALTLGVDGGLWMRACAKRRPQWLSLPH